MIELKSTSPEWHFQLCVEAWEARNPMWVETPSIRDAARDHLLFASTINTGPRPPELLKP